ncbi:helix-turn-helix transcriptional regulator [Lacibacter sp.]|uniref:helix-turn-helix domain-containing protein n=1 Tax=Lacibacter sp. TaxID=1915409 RepID=UPI002B4B5C63|nr:helix-turn-helix transcriptional regulator [Lacibacter sp.]HLP39553.1 helix-turn-helix transcriptional regulator [Lacibacter sp.]
MTVEARFSREAKLFGLRVKQLRKDDELSQAQLGQLILLTQSQVSLIEKGASNFEFNTLIKIGNGLNVTLAALFDYENGMRFRKLSKKYDLERRIKTEKEKFGKRLLDLIQWRSTKQDDLAVISNIDAADLSRFINGEHNMELFNIIKIAEGLKVSLIDLFFYNGPLPKNADFKGLTTGKRS